MRPFVFRLCLFLGINVLLFAGLAHWYPTMRINGYFDAVRFKIARARATPPPRILLVGGSNLAFGVDSAALARATGRPVVNLALSADLGRQFILRQAANEVRRGDLVVLSLEFTLFSSFPGRGYALSALLESAPSSAPLLAVPQWKILSDEGTNYLGLVARSSLTNLAEALQHPQRGHEPKAVRMLYGRDGFNAVGDFVAHHSERGLPFSPKLRHTQLTQSSLRDARDDLAEFVAHCRARGADVCYDAPRLPTETLALYAAEVARSAAMLTRVPDLVLLNSPATIAFPRALFYDTPFHLNRAGGERRTAELIAALHAHGW